MAYYYGETIHNNPQKGDRVMKRKYMRYTVHQNARYWLLFHTAIAASGETAWKAQEGFIRLHECYRDFRRSKTRHHQLPRRTNRDVFSLWWPATLTRSQKRRFDAVWRKHQV